MPHSHCRRRPPFARTSGIAWNAIPQSILGDGPRRRLGFRRTGAERPLATRAARRVDRVRLPVVCLAVHGACSRERTSGRPRLGPVQRRVPQPAVENNPNVPQGYAAWIFRSYSTGLTRCGPFMCKRSSRLASSNGHPVPNSVRSSYQCIMLPAFTSLRCPRFE